MIRPQTILLALLTFFLVGISVACQPETPPPVKIGVIAPLTGEFAQTDGSTTVHGAEIAVEEINQGGGVEVDGSQRLVKLMVEDDQDSPDIALDAARKLTYQDKVVAIAGLPLSRIAIPVASFAETVPIPMISTTSTHPETTAGKDYVFRVGFVDDFQGKIMAQFVYQDLKATRAALLYDVASAYNQGLAKTFQKEFTASGGEIVANETYTTDQNQDFREQLKRIKKVSPDVLFLPNYSQEVERQLKQARELELKTTFVGADAWNDFSEETFPDLEGCYYTTLWHPNFSKAQGEEVKKVVDNFTKSYKNRYNKAPDPNAALAYDAIQLIIAAIDHQGKITPDAIQKGMYNLREYQGVSGIIEYQETGDPVKGMVILTIQAGEVIFYKQVQP